MKDFFMRLTSRKFLLTLAAALILVANERWGELVFLISGYMGIEGIGDAAGRVAAQKTEQVKLIQATEQQRSRIESLDYDGDDLPDPSLPIVAGNQSIVASQFGGDAPL